MDYREKNKEAWNQGVYQAWLQRFGPPEQAAQKIKNNPSQRVGTVVQFMSEGIEGKKIINLLGSNGNKGVALALLGAEVTIVDFSKENERYALELAEAAGTKIRYIVSDVLQLSDQEMMGNYDLVYMEFGILHYFLELPPLFHVVYGLLNQGGRFILQDFHPVSTKLISSKGTTAKIRKHKVTGDYFDTSLVEKEVAYSKFSSEQRAKGTIQNVYLRQWTLGEIVTAVAGEGLMIKVLEELPNLSSQLFDKGIPKTFTLVADKTK